MLTKGVSFFCKLKTRLRPPSVLWLDSRAISYTILSVNSWRCSPTPSSPMLLTKDAIFFCKSKNTRSTSLRFLVRLWRDFLYCPILLNCTAHDRRHFLFQIKNARSTFFVAAERGVPKRGRRKKCLTAIVPTFLQRFLDVFLNAATTYLPKDILRKQRRNSTCAMHEQTRNSISRSIVMEPGPTISYPHFRRQVNQSPRQKCRK